MTLLSQKQVWDNIASEWHEFKTKPAEHTLEFLKEQEGNVLDLGAGTGRHLIKIKNGKMWLVDFSEEMLKYAKEKAKKEKIDAEFIVSELHNLPFKDNFFDSAICISSLHCVEEEKNRKKTINELFRVLKPGAKAEIGVWNKDSSRFKNSKKERYVRWRDKGPRYYYLYEPEEIYNAFKEAGFKILQKSSPDRSIIFTVAKSQT